MADYILKEDVFLALTGDITDCTIEEFIARLREKLSKLPSVGKDINVTTNEDCISRQAVLEEINKVGIKGFETYNDYSQLYDFVDTLPSVTSKKKTGHWIQQQRCEGDEQPDLVCPNCGFKISWWDMGNFCAKCGEGLEGGAE